MAVDDTLGRVLDMVQEELLHNTLQLWYLSYATEEKFLGGVFILAFGPLSAAMRSQAQGLNPGGEVMMIEVPKIKEPEYKYWNRLLTKAEIQRANPDDKWETIAELEAEEE
jgi:hypothetical protein